MSEDVIDYMMAIIQGTRSSDKLDLGVSTRGAMIFPGRPGSRLPQWADLCGAPRREATRALRLHPPFDSQWRWRTGRPRSCRGDTSRDCGGDSLPNLAPSADYPQDRPRRRRFSGEIAFAVLLCVAVGFLTRVESGWQVLVALILAVYGLGSLWEPFPRRRRAGVQRKASSPEAEERSFWPPEIGAFPVRAVLVGIGLFASSLPHWLPTSRSWGLGALLAVSAAVIGRYWLARYPVLEAKGEPGFWKKIGRSNRLFPRKLKFTKEGKILIGITLGIGFAAINTGNNLMYLVLGMLLSLMVVSGILSELSLRGVVVERTAGEVPEKPDEKSILDTPSTTPKPFLFPTAWKWKRCWSWERSSRVRCCISPGEKRTVRASVRVQERAFTLQQASPCPRVSFLHVSEKSFLPGWIRGCDDADDSCRPDCSRSVLSGGDRRGAEKSGARGGCIRAQGISRGRPDERHSLEGDCQAGPVNGSGI